MTVTPSERVTHRHRHVTKPEKDTHTFTVLAYNSLSQTFKLINQEMIQFCVDNYCLQ